jgi:GTP-binding protein HflX
VAAFKATLEELAEADLLLHVLDASRHDAPEQHQAVERILDELGVAGRPAILVLNKIDRRESDNGLRLLVEEWRGVPVSALTGQGIDELLGRIHLTLRPRLGHARLRVPYADGPALTLCYRAGRVLRRTDGPDGVELEVELPAHLLPRVEPYRIDAS